MYTCRPSRYTGRSSARETLESTEKKENLSEENEVLYNALPAGMLCSICLLYYNTLCILLLFRVFACLCVPLFVRPFCFLFILRFFFSKVSLSLSGRDALSLFDLLRDVETGILLDFQLIGL